MIKMFRMYAFDSWERVEYNLFLSLYFNVWINQASCIKVKTLPSPRCELSPNPFHICNQRHKTVGFPVLAKAMCCGETFFCS